MPAFLTILWSSVAHILYRLVLAAASEKILTRLVIIAMEKLAGKTTNTVDDELVAMVATELDGRNLSEAKKYKPKVPK